METKERKRGRREQGSDELGSLPADHRLSAMFTLTALSPPAPNLKGATRQGSISRPVRTGKTAKGLMHEGQDAEVTYSQKCKELNKADV